MANNQVDQLIVANGIDMSEGLIRGEGGADLYTSGDIGSSIRILGGFDYSPDPSTQRNVIAVSSGDVLMDSGGGTFPTILDVNRNTTARVWFSQAGIEASGRPVKLFAANGSDAVLVTSGDNTSTGDLGTPPADWSGTNQPLALVPHNGRMIGFGNLNDPHRIYISDPSNHEVFTSANSVNISVFPGEGNRIVAGMSFKGRFFIFKEPAGIYWLDDSDTTISNWFIKKLNDRIGTISQHTVTLIDDDILFMTGEGGIHLLSAVNALGDVQDSDILVPDEMNQWVRDNVCFVCIEKSSLIYYPNRKQAIAYVPLGTATEPTGKIIIDFNQNIPRIYTSERDTAVSAWLYRDQNGIPMPMIGDGEGQVWSLDQEARSKEGSGYTREFQTAHTDFSYIDQSLENKRKNFDFLELTFQQVGGWNTPVEIYLDGILTETLSFPMSLGQSELGSFVLGTDALIGLSTAPPTVRRRRMRGSGKWLSIRPISTSDSQEFQLSEAHAYFRPADERKP